MKTKVFRSIICLASLFLTHLAWAQRAVNIAVTGSQLTGTGSAKVNLEAQGNENAVSFTFNFDPAVLQYTSSALGSGMAAGSTLIKNETQASSGRVGIAVSLPFGTTFGTSGTKEIVVLNFTVLANSTSTALTFSDSPTARKVVDDAANTLTASFNNTSIVANLPPSAPAITTQPVSQTANPGATVSFTVAASGNPAPTYQWKKDGTDLSGKTGATLTLTNVSGSDVGSYTAVASNGVGSPATSNAATLGLNPGIGSFTPTGGTVGTSVVISGAGFTNASAVKFNGVDAASFTVNSQYQITAIVPTFATNGPITVTPATGSPLVSTTTFTLTAGPRLINSSTLTSSTGGESAVMSTFSVRGGTKQQMLVRVAGPAIAAPPFNVPGTMADPFLAIYDGSGALIASNNDWDPALASAFTAVGAFAYPNGSKDAALLLNLDPGTYVARVTGVGGTTGVVLLETYEYPTSGSTTRVEYLASRASITSGGVGSGFVIGGAGTTGKTTVLIRAVGAGLGVSGALANPTLSVLSGSTTLATNDNHTSTNVSQADLAAATAAAGAMPLAANDSAVLLTLPAGSYTTQVSGVGGTSGVVLTEIFVIDTFLSSAFAPALTAPLHQKAANLGDTVVFAAPYVAKPGPSSFQWQKAGVDISGKTTAVLTLTSVTSADTAAYRILMTNGSGTTTSASAQLDVNKAPQTISFPTIPAKTYGIDTTVSLNATASSGLTVGYALSNANPGTVATLSGNVVTIVNAGTITVTASQPGNADYQAAVDVPQTLTINKGTANIVLAGLTPTYDGTPKPVTATTTPSGLSVNITYTPAGGTATSTAPTNAGNYTVNATVSDLNYQGSQTGNLVIAKASQVVNFTNLPGNKTYGDAPFSMSAVASSGLTPILSIASGPGTMSSNVVTITGAGNIVVKASQAGDSNYNAAPDVTTTIVVAKADQTLTFGALANKTFGDAPFAVSATASSGLTPAFSIVSGPATVSGSTVTITGAGTVTVRASQPGNGNYNAAADVDQSFTVAKANQTISFTLPSSVALDQSPVPLTGTASSGLALTYTSSNTSVATISGNTIILANTGNTTITASQPGNANYNAATSVALNLQVTNQSQTITFLASQLPTKTYADGNFTISATSNRGLLVGFASDNTAVATVSASTLVGGASNATVSIVGAGSANITATQPGDANTAAAPPVTRTFTVNKAAATITLASLSQTYDGTPKAATATTVPSGLNVAFTYTASGGSPTSTAPTDAGSYTVNATISGTSPPESNYTGSASGTLVIAKANQTINFALSSPVLINSSPISLTGNATSNLTVSYASSNTAVATVSGTTLTVKGLGTTTITASQGGNGNYNAAPDVGRNLVVNPIAPVIASTPPLTQTAIVGSNFVFGPITLASQLAAPYSFSATGLPAGLTVNAASGNISGTPTAAPATFSIVLTVSNATGSDSRTINLTLQPPAPVFTSAASANGTVGSAFTYTANASNATSYTLSGTLPAGLGFSGNVISGTPTAAGTSTVNLTATNATGSVTMAVTISVAFPPNAPVYSGPTNPSGTAGTVFSFTPVFSGTVTSYAQTGTLPVGLNFSSTTGAITGTTNQVGSFPIVISATGAGVTVPVSLTLTINPSPTAPVISSASTASGTAGSAFSYTITASGGPTSFAAVDAIPAGTIVLGSSGLSLNTTSGVLSGTLTKAPGTVRLALTATNSAGTSASAILIITVSPSATAPVITSPVIVNGQVGVALTYNLTATAGVGGAVLTAGNVTYSNSGTLPAGLTLNGTAGTVTGTPSVAGNYENIFFVGTDNNGFKGLGLEIMFNIAAAASVPVVNSNGTAAGQVGQLFNYTITGTNGPTSFAATSLPAGLSLDAATGVISGVPSTDTSVTIAVTASNGAGTSAPKNVVLTIAPAPATPVITSAPTALGRVGTAFTYNITASDGPTSFAATPLPAGLSVNAATGAISGTPTEAGAFTAVLRARNTAGDGTQSPLLFTIAPALTAPVITSAAAATGQVGVAFSYQIVATPTPISNYSCGTLPLGLNYNGVTGTITGIPATPGTTTVNVTATGPGGTSLPQPLTITISPAAGVPVITSAGAAGGIVGGNFTYTITTNPAATTFDAVNLPAGLAVNTNTGIIVGQPTAAGNTTASLVATNAAGTGPTRDLVITITPPTNAPVVSSATSASGQVGVGFSYQITATNSPTSFEVLGAPSWMTISTAGALAGTPTAPGSVTVQLVATNVAGSSNPVTLTITIAAAAGTPIITSTRNVQGTAGATFSHQITASPAATTFVATGLPAGLTLNTATGAIIGTPSVSGAYQVTVTASNASGSSAPVRLNFTILPSATLVIPGR